MRTCESKGLRVSHKAKTKMKLELFFQCPGHEDARKEKNSNIADMYQVFMRFGDDKE